MQVITTFKTKYGYGFKTTVSLFCLERSPLGKVGQRVKCLFFQKLNFCEVCLYMAPTESGKVWENVWSFSSLEV